MQLTLGLTGLLSLFEGRIFSASDVERGKPWPDLFIHAAATMGVDPADCVVVEDSVHGVRAARAAGMTCFGFAGGLTPADALSMAGAIVFHEMHELERLV
jgi:beta-phosphoglucomutase-like phosphatase (HAD superfamily)